MESSSGNSLNDSDRHHTSSETSNLVNAYSVSVNSSLLEGSDEGEEGFGCSNKSKKFIIKESLKETGPLSDKSEPSSITSLRDVYVGSSSQKGDISECSTDQVESNYRISVKHDIFESTESESFKSEKDLEREVLARKSVKSGVQNQDFVKMEKANVNQPLDQSHLADCRDGSDLLVDVKVCDICGDAGREDLLAICSKCADGAEHIYCMRIKLDKVPRGNWMCEECVSSQETEKDKRYKSEVPIRNLNRSSQIYRNAGNSSTSTIKNRFTEASDARESNRDTFSTVPNTPAKRKPGDFGSALVKKRRVETTIVDSAPSHQPMSRGTLSKSWSFNNSDLKRDVQLREESQKRKSCGQASATDNRTDGSDRKISKSLSFNNGSSVRQNIGHQKFKMLPISTSGIDDLKIRSSLKRSRLILNNLVSKSDKPRVSSPTSGSCSSPSKKGKSILCNVRPTEVHSSGSKNLNPKRSHHLVNSRDSSKPAHHVGPEDRAVTGGFKKLRSCLSDVAQHPSRIIPNSFREQNPKGTLRSNSFPPNSRNRANTGQIVQVKKIQSPESSNRDEKTHEGSNFGTIIEQIKCGNLQGHKSKGKVHASESCRVISPLASVQEGRKKDYVDQSNPKDLGSNIFLQTHAARKFAVPCPGFIWKGGFEMAKGEELPNFISGIQAHVCTWASPKAFEVAKKFPCNIRLEEVSRSSIWPTQFQQNNPNENNVALYFFAVDFRSYERNYRSMVECLMYHDRALKGTVDELELLIFPSNLLPCASQRWNNLFYLWGLFKGKKIIKENCRTNNPSVPALDNAIPDRDNSIPDWSEFENTRSSRLESESFNRVRNRNSQCETSSGNEALIPDLNSGVSDHDYGIPDKSASKLYHNAQHPSNFISPLDLPSASSERNADDLNPELPCPEQKKFDIQTNFDSKDRVDSNNFQKDRVLAEGKNEDPAVAIEPRENPNNKVRIKLFGQDIISFG